MLLRGPGGPLLPFGMERALTRPVLPEKSEVWEIGAGTQMVTFPNDFGKTAGQRGPDSDRWADLEAHVGERTRRKRP